MQVANAQMIFFLFRIPKLRTSKMFQSIVHVQERNRPLCAIRGAVRAFAVIHAVELLETEEH